MPTHKDRCDYQAVGEAFPWIREKGRHFIVSADLDGMMSGVLLSHTLGWVLVGFYTVNDLYVVAEPNGGLDQFRKDPEALLRHGRFVFVDHDIYRQDILSVGHHLLQWSSETPIPLHTQDNASLNPNLLRGITKKQAFNRKYPFGTFHFLLACFSAWGMLKDFAPDDEMTTLLLHIDSSFESAIKYQENALGWLDWLGGSEPDSPLYPICRRMLKFNPRKIIEEFARLADRFGEWGLKPRRQAPFSNPHDAAAWEAQQRLLAWVRSKTGWSLRSTCAPDKRYFHFTVKRSSAKPNKAPFASVIARSPFSYALIGTGEEGFNYGWLEGAMPESTT